MIPIGGFWAGRRIASKYRKSLSPPKGEPYLETAGGLRYWYVGNKSPCGSYQSVLTEDSSISMHSYGNPDSRNPNGGMLFRYKGTSIGFITHRFFERRHGVLISKRVRSIKDTENRISYNIVTAIGKIYYVVGDRYMDDSLTGDLVLDADGNHMKSEDWVKNANLNSIPHGSRG